MARTKAQALKKSSVPIWVTRILLRTVDDHQLVSDQNRLATHDWRLFATLTIFIPRLCDSGSRGLGR